MQIYLNTEVNISKKSFVGQELIIEGDYNEEKVFIMQALTPVDLFSATATQVRTDDAKEFILKRCQKTITHNIQRSSERQFMKRMLRLNLEIMH